VVSITPPFLSVWARRARCYKHPRDALLRRPPFNGSGSTSITGALGSTGFGLALATWAAAVAVTGVTGEGRRFVSTHCLGFSAASAATADIGIEFGCSEPGAESSSWEALISHEETFGDTLAIGPAGRLAIGIPGMDSGRGMVAVYGYVRANTTRQWRLSQVLFTSAKSNDDFG
jgi:hypothetical protein